MVSVFLNLCRMCWPHWFAIQLFSSVSRFDIKFTNSHNTLPMIKVPAHTPHGEYSS